MVNRRQAIWSSDGGCSRHQTRGRRYRRVGYRTGTDRGLTVQLPEQKPCDHAITFKIV
jgi:hypothetical protein